MMMRKVTSRNELKKIVKLTLAGNSDKYTGAVTTTLSNVTFYENMMNFFDTTCLTCIYTEAEFLISVSKIAQFCTYKKI